MTSYRYSAYRRGSTNGQRPFAHCIVTDVSSKNEGAAIALRHLKAYKVLGNRLGSRENPQDVAKWTVDLYKHACPIIAGRAI